MLHKFEGEEHGIIEIATTMGEVRDRTSRGWRLLAILEAEVVVPQQEEVSPPPPPQRDPNDYGNTYNPTPDINPSYTRHFTETQFTYVLAQPKDQRIEELVTERDDAVGARQTQWDRAVELESEVESLTKQVKGGTEIENKLEADLAAAVKATQEANDKVTAEAQKRKDAVEAGGKATRVYNQRMEILWQELGAARMRELLGHDVESPIPLPKPKSAMERIADDETP